MHDSEEKKGKNTTILVTRSDALVSLTEAIDISFLFNGVKLGGNGASAI